MCHQALGLIRLAKIVKNAEITGCSCDFYTPLSNRIFQHHYSVLAQCHCGVSPTRTVYLKHANSQ